MTTQNLYIKLKFKQAKSEEDVKDGYIKALGLKSYTKGLVDIRTDEIWFEAKDTGKHSSYAMFTQLLHYVQDALNKGEPVPPFLAVIDTEKAALMKTSDVLPFLAKKTVKWGKSASQYPKEALDEVSAHIGTHFVSFKIATHEDEFIQTVVVNHFIPFTEAEVNAPERFESDFMVRYLEKKKLSKEAKAVLDAGRELWKAYFSETDIYNMREEFKLNRADVGWYQIRNALKKRIETPVDFSDFETVYKNLSAKLQPLVFELGFLRDSQESTEPNVEVPE